MNILKKAQTTSIFTKSKFVTLTIFDGGQEDGDVVTILANGKVILRRYIISKEKKILEIPISVNKTTITIIAESTGSITTNTAVVEINDDYNNIRALTNLKKGESTKIDVLIK